MSTGSARLQSKCFCLLTFHPSSIRGSHTTRLQWLQVSSHSHNVGLMKTENHAQGLNKTKKEYHSTTKLVLMYYLIWSNLKPVGLPHHVAFNWFSVYSLITISIRRSDDGQPLPWIGLPWGKGQSKRLLDGVLPSVGLIKLVIAFNSSNRDARL